MAKDHGLPEHGDDVATFEGPFGYASVREPAKSPTAPKKIGASQGTFYGFWRVVFVIEGLGADVYQVADEDEGREVAKRLVNDGELGDLAPNDGTYKVTADLPFRRSDPNIGTDA